ncbi:MAG: DUF2070 family protein [Methanocellales archaeon]|nr:DUF2070 family protein [Methanocellales archaeon]
MIEIEERTAELTKYIFKAPKWSYSLPFLLIFSIIIGMGALKFGHGWLWGAKAGLALIGAPAVISAVLTPPIALKFGGVTTLNRSSLLALACTIVIGVFCGASALFSVLLNASLTFDGYIMALGVVFAMRMLVLLGISNKSIWRTSPPASLQTLFGGMFLLFYTHSEIYYVNLVIGCAIFTLACYLFVRYIDAPVKKSFGVSGLDFIRSFIALTADGRSEMEDFFRKMGEAVDVPVTILNFATNGKSKATFVTAMVHPGPMGEIGGGNLPVKIANSLDGVVFVPHSTAYHDFNLVSATEIQKIISAAQSALAGVRYADKGTRSIRVKNGDVMILGQRFDDSVLLTATQSPLPTEDIEFAVGLAAISEARVKGVKHAALVDAHNCATGKSRIITPGSRISYEIIRAVSDATERLLAMPEGKIRIGVSKRDAMYSIEEGMGALGIRVAVVEALGQKTAYVLIDGNNMVAGLREAIISALPTDETEIMTTDTHVVNMASGNNFVGMKMDRDELIKTIKEMTDEAIADLGPVQVGMNTEFAEDVIIFGSHRTAQLASTVNAIMAMGGALAISIVIVALVLAMLAFAMTS